MEKKKPQMNKDEWLARANPETIRIKISNMNGLEDFQAIINFTKKQTNIDWNTSIALLHMVYGWMPTMLRPIVAHSKREKKDLLSLLMTVKNNQSILTDNELCKVIIFTNGSVVGASKLLHILSPNNYAIWDSRVANQFLWEGVSPQTFSTLHRYNEYLNAIREWSKDKNVIAACKNIRELHSSLRSSSNLRIIEFVLYLK